MAVRYVSFDGEQVSAEIGAFLSAARRAGVSFNVREGHRTFARQAYFYWLSFRGGNAAARPSPFAPHIRTGRIDHALDVGGATALIAYGRRVGVNWRRTVHNEEWHIEAPAAELIRFAASRVTTTTIRRGSTDRRAIRELQTLLKKVGAKGFRINGRYDLPTRRAVRRWQAKHGMTADGVAGPRTWQRLRKQATK